MRPGTEISGQKAPEDLTEGRQRPGGRGEGTLSAFLLGLVTSVETEALSSLSRICETHKALKPEFFLWFAWQQNTT